MKKRITFVICIAWVLLIIMACNQTPSIPKDALSDSAASPYRKITAEDGKKLLDRGSVLTLVDVRRVDEYETSHIPGAINIPNESIVDNKPTALPDLNETVIVYCRTGVRSKQAADKLVEMGYSDVRDMGGIVDWPYETVSGSEPGEYITDSSGSDTTSSGIMGNFKAKDIDGDDINQSIFSDYDLTMVNVWATYCGPCISEMPDLGDLSREYESRGVRIVGMISDVLNADGTVSDSQMDTARSIVETTDADYLHIIPSEDLYGLLSQITAVPTTFFVNSNGEQVGSAYLGSKSKAQWTVIISELLEENQK